MAQYIDKDALVAEIENILDYTDEHWDTDYATGARWFTHKLRDAINNLEVKEVDLEKEIQQQYNVHKNPDNSIAKDCVIMTKDGFEYFAKYFFELGMSVSNKAQKGE